MLPKKIIHLLSGGLDSVTMLYDLKNQGHSVHCLLFDYRQPHDMELDFAILHARRSGALFTEIDLPALGGMSESSWVVPNRNAIMLSIAVNVAINSGSDTVTIGCNASDSENFPDCRKEFIDAMNASVRAAGYGVEICAPYLDKPKAWIARLASDFGIKSNEIWTCYQPQNNKPCGSCPACEKLDLATGGAL